jgi:hypothetical protein
LSRKYKVRTKPSEEKEQDGLPKVVIVPGWLSWDDAVSEWKKVHKELPFDRIKYELDQQTRVKTTSIREKV